MEKESSIEIVSAEVLAILKNFPEELVNRIPKTFLDSLEKSKDPSYNVIIDDSKKLFEQNVSDEAQIMMYLIYRDYWATPEDKDKINAKIKKIKEDFDEDYSAEKLFSQNQENEHDEK